MSLGRVRPVELLYGAGLLGWEEWRAGDCRLSRAETADEDESAGRRTRARGWM